MVYLKSKVFLTIFLSSYSLVVWSFEPASAPVRPIPTGLVPVGAGVTVGADVRGARTPLIKASRSDGDFSRVGENDPRRLGFIDLPTTEEQVERIIGNNGVNLKKVSGALYLLAGKFDEQSDCHRAEMARAAGEIATNKTRVAYLEARLALVERELEKPKSSCCQRLLNVLFCGCCKS